jgi:signal transduction histidine kinase
VVEVTGSPRSLCLRVADSGAGLSTAAAEQVFERGWSTKTADGPVGRGLGLALVVQAVRKYDGRIEVGTSELGGAEFVIRIGEPATSSDEPSPSVPEPTTSRGTGRS